MSRQQALKTVEAFSPAVTMELASRLGLERPLGELDAGRVPALIKVQLYHRLDVVGIGSSRRM